ncbi:DUF1592 domain-containing protein [Marinicellulosiphila megalodicopiae]|uniref:DUF1592 domain-containing protein n=1 Tax=Marinicellulosiphila megalodicopiae TaxID=2724896 RepID=UPI003BB15A85
MAKRPFKSIIQSTLLISSSLLLLSCEFDGPPSDSTNHTDDPQAVVDTQTQTIVQELDTDQDSVIDRLDDDDDNDGIVDAFDVFPLDPLESKDYDNDGIGDNSDDDLDNDTYKNSEDRFPLDVNEWADFDNDGLGDNSDPDIDNDGTLNEDDVNSFDAMLAHDMDNDGKDDSIDDDIDGDGILNIHDADPLNALIQVDADSDGIDDSVDDFIDVDADNVADIDDAFPNDSQRSSCDLPNDAPVYGQQQMRLLLSHEYINSISDILNIDVDKSQLPNDPTVFYNIKTGNQQSVNTSNLDLYINLANSVTEQFSYAAFTTNEHTLGCLENQNCKTQFIDELLPRIFRRDINIDEQARFSYFFDNAEFNTQDNPKAGFELALRTALTSPNFLFRFEIGKPIANEDNKFELTTFEMASFLSYTYTGSTPDDELLIAAKNNALQTDAQILVQIERLLETDRAQIQMGEFAAQWMGSEGVLHSQKDLDLFPNFDDTVKASMNQQTKEIFKDAFFTQHRTFEDLYDTNFAMMDQVLLDFYSASVDGDAISDETFSRVFLPEYAGLTASSAFLTQNAQHDESSILKRGAFIRENMLCQNLPLFPTDIDLGPIREVQAQKVEDITKETQGYISPAHLTFINIEPDACQGCHETIIAPLGLGLEDYDAVGKLRDTYANGIPVDFMGFDETDEYHKSALYGSDNIYEKNDPIFFEGAKELGDILAKSETAKACYTEMAFRFTMGHGIQNNDYYGYHDVYTDEQKLSNTCVKNKMLSTMQDNNDSLKFAFIQLGLSDLVRLRTHYTAEQ